MHALSSLAPWANAIILGVVALVLSPLLGKLADALPAQVDDSQVWPATQGTRARQLLFGLLCALPAAACGWRFGLGAAGLAATAFMLMLATLAWVDAYTGLLPDALTLSLLWLGLLVNLGNIFTPLPHAVIGAAAGYLFFWIIFQAFLLFTGREGLGYGDFKLLAALGAWLGWTALPNIVLIASVSALVVTRLRRWVSGADMNHALHYGPYLALAGAVQLFLGFFWAV